MTTVVTAEIDTSPAERSAKAFSGLISSMRTEAKNFQTSVDGMNDSVKKFNLAAVGSNFSKPIASEAATVVKSAAAVTTGFKSTSQSVKDFLATLGSSIWNGVKAGIQGVINVVLALGGAALSGFGLFRSEVEKTNGTGPGGLGGFLATLLTAKAILVGLVAAGVGFATKLAHDVVEVADDFEDTQKKLDALGLSLANANVIADRNGATIKTVANEYSQLSASMVGMHATVGHGECVGCFGHRPTDGNVRRCRSWCSGVGNLSGRVGVCRTTKHRCSMGSC